MATLIPIFFHPGNKLPGYFQAIPDGTNNDTIIVKLNFYLLLSTFLCLTALGYAQQITGTVNNATTGRTAVAADVVLLKLSEGMQESTRTKSDARGAFTLAVPDNGPHLVRVTHQGVNYFRPAPPGTTSVEVDVYDASTSVDGIVQQQQTMLLQADASELQVVEYFVVRNESKPARTLISDKSTFEMQLPEGVKIEGASAASGSMPVRVAPVRLDGKGRYAFVYPIKPGQTQFHVAYRLPYRGDAKITPVLLRKIEQFGVVLPKEMEFKSASNLFSPSQDQAGMRVNAAVNVGPGSPLTFEVSGRGQIPDPQQGGEISASARELSGQPGGGMAPPSNNANPLAQYQWWILGGLAIAMIGGAWYAMRLGKQSGPTPAHGGVSPASVFRSNHAASSAESRDRMLLQVVKDELFELESEKIRGEISAAEYERIKAALEAVLERALRRERRTAAKM